MNVENLDGFPVIKLLDHGHVRLVDNMGNDLSIVRNARVSYDADWRAGEDEKSDARLIQYLMSHKHNTPFETVCFTFDVKAPIFVFRQWHRHRTQSYNELSARYKPLPNETYIPDINTIGRQSKHNKQMRNIEHPYTESEYEDVEAYLEAMKLQNNSAHVLYKEMLELGIPRELARSVLPISTYSHMFTTVNLHNLFRFLSERLMPEAQYEIRIYAQAIFKLIEPIVPVATQAFAQSLPQQVLSDLSYGLIEQGL